jgi:hypothetical protein
MSSFKRSIRSLATLVGVGVLAGAGLVALAPTAVAAGHPAGFMDHLILGTGQVFPSGHPYDVATNTAGTAFIGWISSTTTSSDRTIHLCKLPIGATSCTGGIQTIPAGITLADDLFVLVTGDDVVHLVWRHDVFNSPNGAIAEATALHGLNLSAPQDVVNDAAGLHYLLDAQVDPDGGAIWTVGYAGPPTQSVQVRSNLTGALPTSVPTPYPVGYAQIAFTGYLSGAPVLAVENYGSIGTAVHYATRSGGVWSSFHAVAHTWAVGTNAVLKASRHGLRVVTGVNDARYRPVISKWTGTGFTARQLTADGNSCSPASHDGWADLSERLLDVSWECNELTVTNYADAFHAAIVRLPVTGTTTQAPQIASGIRGIASVAYSVQTSNGDALRFVHVRLPDSTQTITKTGFGGRVTVTGPRSCLPPVNVHIDWTHRPATNWTFESGALRLDGNIVSGSTLDGATLTPGNQYTLIGTAVFGRGSDRNTVQTSLTFRVCGTG